MNDESKNLSRARILICEDEMILAQDLTHILRGLGYEVVGAVSTGEESIRLAEEAGADLILMDMKLKGEMDGIEAAEQIRAAIDVPVVYVTAYGEAGLLERAKLTKPYGYLTKPIDPLGLKMTVETALYKHEADKRVNESEKRLALALEGADLGWWDWNVQTGELLVNERWAEICGYSLSEVIPHIDWWKDLIHPEDRPIVLENLDAHLRGLTPSYEMEHRFATKTGEWKWILVRGRVIDRDGEGNCLRVVGTRLDITDRRKAEEELRKNEERLQAIFEGAAEGILVADVQTKRFKYANQAVCDLLGYSRDELCSLSVFDIHPRASLDHVIGEFQAQAAGEKVLSADLPSLRKDGTIIQTDIRTTPIEIDGIACNVGFFSDITDRKKAEERLKSSLAEKEVLLREIHHRVKNNLAVIVSLLKMHGRAQDNESVGNLLWDIADRIRAMGLAHEMLYHSDNLALLSASHYVEKLVDHLFASKSQIGASITLQRDIADAKLGLDILITVGFILTELLTNCLRHAFPDGRGGDIRISLRPVHQCEFELVVTDNGVGLPDDIDLQDSKSLGWQLVHIFAQQLNASVEIIRGEGTEVRIRFKETTA